MSANLTHNYDQDLALTRGKWVNVRGIMRWQGARPVDEEEVAADHPDYIACPKCRVKSWDFCRTPAGAATKAHAARIIPRRCRCGGALKPQQHKCDTCVERRH